MASEIMYVRELQGLLACAPVFHRRDIDEGGFRNAATPAQKVQTVGRAIRPWAMHPDDVPEVLRRKATPKLGVYSAFCRSGRLARAWRSGSRGGIYCGVRRFEAGG